MLNNRKEIQVHYAERSGQMIGKIAEYPMPLRQWLQIVVAFDESQVSWWQCSDKFQEGMEQAECQSDEECLFQQVNKSSNQIPNQTNQPIR